MRRARLTYKGAYHHAVNRGYDGKPIFQKKNNKESFLNMTKMYSEKLKIRIFAYCVMDNHYHLILENSSGRMSDFFKQLNGNFGSYYRKENGGKGYVFQERYRSMLIQDDPYLMLAIAYVLNNPVRAGIVKNFPDYKWSSASLYFSENSGKKGKNEIVDTGYIEDLFQSKSNLVNMVKNSFSGSLPIIETRVGKLIGGEGFVSEAMNRFDRRSGKESLERKRFSDKYFDPLEKIYMEFERKYNLKVEKIDVTSIKGKRLRSEMLFNLKERGGLKYTEIIKLDLFSDLKLNSLGQLYKRAQCRLTKK